MLILIIVSIFFLYLLLFSQNIFFVLNCKVQKFLLNNIYFRQVMIFFTIYFFTFVLNWYTPYNIFPKIFSDNVNNVFKYLGLTLLIYIFFILTTCLNLPSTIALFFSIFILLNLYLHKNSSITDKSKEDLINPTNLSNILDLSAYYSINIFQVGIVLLIIGGFIYNLIVTKKVQGNKFKFIKFLFSGGLCL
jgi:hypothetical protein